MQKNIYFNTASLNNVLIWVISFIVFPLSKFFVAIKISANYLTFFSLLFTIFAFYYLINDNYLYFSLFWMGNIILDFCDGQVARLSRKVNKTLFRFDAFSDFFKLSIIFLGVGIYYNDPNVWIFVFLTNFLYLFSVILEKNLYQKIEKKSKNQNHFFINYFKTHNLILAMVKTVIPVVLQVNGHSLLLFFFLPLSIENCIIILIYFNLLFLYKMHKTTKLLLKQKI